MKVVGPQKVQTHTSIYIRVNRENNLFVSTRGVKVTLMSMEHVVYA